MCGVDAFDVEGRIGLRVAQALRVFQHLIEPGTLFAHLGQDEVAGAVDDAGDPLDAVGGQAFAQRLDDRDAAGHGGLEGHHHAPGDCAAAKISLPCIASSALLAVTTCLPFSIAARIRSLATV